MELKSAVQWIAHPDGHWILRNPEDMTFMEVDDFDKHVILQLSKQPVTNTLAEYNIDLEDVQNLLRSLAQTGMLEGTKAPKAKFNLLSFTIPLVNPDVWLSQHIDKLRWIWTWEFGFFLCAFIASSAAAWFGSSAEVVVSHQQLWTAGKIETIITFVLLTILVISLHELGHAFTLKHYGGIVKEIGLLFMCFIPGCYTDTSDQYSLVKRKQRVLVVAAGVLIQVTIWAFAVWVWLFSQSNPVCHQISYLLMVAALLTVAINLNPLNRFDGYYLLVAGTGINNLRQKSFDFYMDLLRREEIEAESSDRLVLAAYAPLSIIYTVFALSYLMSLLGNWVLRVWSF
ncbi:MAG: M50 family peptidase [Oscillatoriales cyanobacterium]|uniref:Site-2 protease family protein n=1 Tax=Microcoleus anatoxicus PTRS2 TaxID=2705321 RepID=A0ABU8YW91_9CYAN|nr:MAG: M50 family peptidase [Oscillatoriales cyanobacterium]TAE03586.1 MAG: M50 family peptidase [Oscillatoriales cyanobacterium]